MARCRRCGNGFCTCGLGGIPKEDTGGISPGLGLFQLLSIFDWITPARAIADDVAHSVKTGSLTQSRTFYLPTQKSVRKGWNGRDIEKLLKKHGIKSWGHMDYFNEYLFCVDLNDAERAEQVLTRAGVPLKDK